MNLGRLVLGLVVGAVACEIVVIPCVFFLGWTGGVWSVVWLLWGIACGCVGMIWAIGRADP